ncbi:hypothetical protein RN001_005350 [Aquatica leii]|uniref:EF-hand domain-containing protein n=1 Tax=Aquatica leii TaxID=1421715 RepID=A0AAN7SAJ1_9COLE|nr:hypothetical protein RN001_005350 [Aquatica leii]
MMSSTRNFNTCIVYDRFQQGVINRKTMQLFLESSIYVRDPTETTEDMVKDLIEIIMRDMDADRDGVISPSDYASYCLKKPLCMEAFGECWPSSTVLRSILASFTNRVYYINLLTKRLMLLRTGKLKPYRKLKPKMDNLSENEENKGEENYVYSRVVPLENKIADCDKSIGEIHGDVSVLGRTVGLVESDVKEMAREMQNLEVKCSKVKVNQGLINTNIPIVVKPAEEKPKFDPSKRSGHPVKFLRKLANYFKKIDEANKIDKAIECLKGDARIWAECYMQRWQNFEEFKEDFSRQFWSQDQQEQIRASIYEPRIYNRRNGNFSQHIWYWVDKTQHLEPPIPEKY